MPWYSNSLPMPTRNLRKCQFIWQSFGMSQPAAALSFTNMMNPHLFFFTLSPFVFFSSRVLHCRKPVRLFACQQGHYFSSLSPSTCVEQSARPRNSIEKRWDAYEFGRKYEDEPGGELSLCLPERLGSGEDNEQRTYTLSLNSMNDSCKRIVWDAATCHGTLKYKHD